jgi:single-strand DNA-binding protein
MSGVNKFIVLGNLTKDPELSKLPNGTSKCEFTIATSEKFKKNGQTEEQSEFHNFTAWGQQAEVIAQYKKKGETMYVSAKKRTTSWEKDGKKQYKIEFHVVEFEFVGGNKSNAETSQDDDELPFA